MHKGDGQKDSDDKIIDEGYVLTTIHSKCIDVILKKALLQTKSEKLGRYSTLILSLIVL